jgi:hypothetical protein
MKVYVFGNPDYPLDNLAIKIAQKIKKINFVFVKPNEDLPFVSCEKVILMDVIQGLKKEEVFDDVDKLIVERSSTAHDYDLGFQLKYLKKLGEIGEVVIIGLPPTGKINYRRIQSILRKLVAQDMQGS